MDENIGEAVAKKRITVSAIIGLIKLNKCYQDPILSQMNKLVFPTAYHINC